MVSIPLIPTVTTAYRSEAQKAKDKAKRRAANKSGTKPETPTTIEKIHGNTKLGLPFTHDLWRDCCNAMPARISVQVQLALWKRCLQEDLCPCLLWWQGACLDAANVVPVHVPLQLCL